MKLTWGRVPAAASEKYTSTVRTNGNMRAPHSSEIGRFVKYSAA
jgi:hypothetical protein